MPGAQISWRGVQLRPLFRRDGFRAEDDHLLSGADAGRARAGAATLPSVQCPQVLASLSRVTLARVRSSAARAVNDRLAPTEPAGRFRPAFAGRRCLFWRCPSWVWVTLGSGSLRPDRSRRGQGLRHRSGNSGRPSGRPPRNRGPATAAELASNVISPSRICRSASCRRPCPALAQGFHLPRLAVIAHHSMRKASPTGASLKHRQQGALHFTIPAHQTGLSRKKAQVLLLFSSVPRASDPVRLARGQAAINSQLRARSRIIGVHGRRVPEAPGPSGGCRCPLQAMP